MRALASPHVHFVIVKPHAQDLELLGSWIMHGLKALVFQTIKIKDAAVGFKRLQADIVHSCIAVDIAGGWD